MSAASQLEPNTPAASEADEDLSPASASSRPTEPRSWTVPAPPIPQIPPIRDRLSTLELEELDEPLGASPFDFHDTIPAPPWLEGLEDADFEMQPLPPLPAR